MTDQQIPPNFDLYTPESPALQHFQPMYRRLNQDGTIVFGLKLQAHHLNAMGVVHGGVLLTLADAALGQSFSRRLNAPVVTVSLNADFIAPVSPDTWIETHVVIHRVGQRLVFGDCHLTYKDQLLLKASGVFARIKPHAKKS